MSLQQAIHPGPCAAAAAQAASLQALLNTYLREIAAGSATLAGSRDSVEIPLSHIPARLRVQIEYFSQSGPHCFGPAQIRFSGSSAWQAAAPVQVLTLVAQECFARLNAGGAGKLPDFLRGIFNSNAEIEAILCRHADAPEPDGFLAAEQALSYGHWLHPTPKSRDGLTGWQQAVYAPEYAGRFRLAFFAADSALVAQGAAQGTAAGLVRQIPGAGSAFRLQPHETLIPAHPLQAQMLRLDPAVQALMASGRLRDLGEGGCAFAATSSMRTLFAPECPWMLKFSIPVRLTNSLRVTKRNELETGVSMARLLRGLGAARLSPRFRIINDPAYLTLNLPGRSESGFEVIFRENPFTGRAGQGVYNLAALTADPLPGRSALLTGIIQRLASDRGQPAGDTACRWFDAYLDCMLDPVLELYDRHGIALEAHQQNSLLDLGSGLPSCGYYRDNQGYFIAQDAFPRLCALEPSLAGQPALVYPRAHINERLAYYLVVNQIFAVIRRLGRDGLASEPALLLLLRRRLSAAAARLTGAGAEFARYLLTAPSLTAKANLLTRAHNVDELQTETQEGLFLQMPNPIAAARPKLVQELADVPA
ncbi:IucA/IucC family protein [Leisingera daeponensis]|uniref:IucA/IucC family protein n=1 Tax=Leisingera daeponensis TaxID=405746 RepID=UPI001C98B3A1|nr:IucA/IucC family protein [Leisingera daeponensis]MBY6057978.1 siderophore biosynthesis protein [Leisingera daeponensis]